MFSYILVHVYSIQDNYQFSYFVVLPLQYIYNSIYSNRTVEIPNFIINSFCYHQQNKEIVRPQNLNEGV
jgi:hypothetical protein